MKWLQLKTMRQPANTQNLILDVVFPPQCVNCGDNGKWLCDDCYSLVEIFEIQYCPFCAAPKIVADGKTCNNCAKTKRLNGLFCSTTYQNIIVRALIRQLKYPPSLATCLVPILSSFIIQHFQLLNKNNFKDYLWIPVPLHKKKLKQRGFNQAALLCEELSRALEGDFTENALVKIRSTSSQVELDRKQREQNVAGSLACPDSATIKGRDIFLVDDVFTTGATMEECAKVLRDSGAKTVWGVVVARE